MFYMITYYEIYQHNIEHVETKEDILGNQI